MVHFLHSGCFLDQEVQASLKEFFAKDKNLYQHRIIELGEKWLPMGPYDDLDFEYSAAFVVS